MSLLQPFRSTVRDTAAALAGRFETCAVLSRVPTALAISLLVAMAALAWTDSAPGGEDTVPRIAASGLAIGIAATVELLRRRCLERGRAHESLTRLCREQQERLRHADRISSLGRLAASVAHDLSSPATFVQGNLEELGAALDEIRAVLEGYDALARAVRRTGGPAREALARVDAALAGRDPRALTEDARPILEDCLEGTRRIRDLVLAIRDHARREEATAARADVPREIERALRLVGREIRRTCRLETALSVSSAARCAPGHLQQILVNLLLNASHAIEGEGRIRIEAREDAGSIILRVHDDGRGIPGDVLPHVFEPFFTTKGPGQGTGLGLAICRDLAESHGGRIEIESHPGEGTTVSLRLEKVREACGVGAA